VQELQVHGKCRAAGKLFAELRGVQCDENELNLDVESEGCHEFDYASDSSLVLHWTCDEC